MAKELYLYSGIYPFTAQSLIEGMELNSGQDLTLRINSPGGDVMSGWGIIAKMQEHSGKITAKVDGCAMSMAVMPVVFADYVEMLDVSTLMIHRASMYVENAEDQAWLDNVNKNLRSKLETKIDSDALKLMKGVSISELFENEKRIDLFLTAKEAKKLGLADKINKLSPEVESQITAIHASMEKYYKVAANGNPDPLKNKNMTIESLKAEHPAVYAQVFELGKTAGVTAQKEIAEVWAHFAKEDPDGVKAGVKSGVAPTPLQILEMTQKQFAPSAVAAIVADNAAEVVTTEPDKEAVTAKAELDAWAADVRKNSQYFKTA